MTLLWIALAGGVGAMARYAVDLALTPRLSRPGYALALINVSGSLLIGLLAGLLTQAAIPTAAATIAMTGFLGGYTTFSAASLDILETAEREGWTRGLSRALAIPVLAVAACGLGLAVGNLLG